MSVFPTENRRFCPFFQPKNSAIVRFSNQGRRILLLRSSFYPVGKHQKSVFHHAAYPCRIEILHRVNILKVQDGIFYHLRANSETATAQQNHGKGSKKMHRKGRKTSFSLHFLAVSSPLKEIITIFAAQTTHYRNFKASPSE